jgi:hypothetical protein
MNDSAASGEVSRETETFDAASGGEPSARRGSAENQWSFSAAG